MDYSTRGNPVAIDVNAGRRVKLDTFSSQEDRSRLIVAAPLTRHTESTGLRLYMIEFAEDGFSTDYTAYALYDAEPVGEAYQARQGRGQPPRQHMEPGAFEDYRGLGIGTMLYLAGGFTKPALNAAEKSESGRPYTISTDICDKSGIGRNRNAERWWGIATGRKGIATRGTCETSYDVEIPAEETADEILDWSEINAIAEAVEEAVKEAVGAGLGGDEPAFTDYLESFCSHRTPHARVNAAANALSLDIRELIDNDIDGEFDSEISFTGFEASYDEDSREATISFDLSVTASDQASDESLMYDVEGVEGWLNNHPTYENHVGYQIVSTDILRKPSYKISFEVVVALSNDMKDIESLSIDSTDEPEDDLEATLRVSVAFEGIWDTLEGSYQMEQAGLIFALNGALKEKFAERGLELPAITVPERYANLDFDAENPYVVGMVAGLNGMSYAREAIEAVKRKLEKTWTSRGYAGDYLRRMIRGAESTAQEFYEPELDLFPRAANPPSPRRIERELRRRDLALMDLADID